MLCLLLVGCGENREKTLHIYVWSDYIHPEVIAAFEEKFDCRVLIDTFDSNESMVAKLLVGGGGYDLIFPTQYFVQILDGQELLYPLDRKKIPNLKNIDWDELESFHIPLFKKAVPYLISTTGIGYRTERVKEPTSWKIFGDKSFKGRMTLLNDVREVLGVALLTLGYSVNSTSREEIVEATRLVLKWRENIAKFDSDYKNGIASSEFLLSQAYSGEIQQVILESPEVDFSLPIEGGIVSADMMVIPLGAEAIDLAHDFINFLLKPKMARLNMEYAYGNPVNRPMFEALPRSFQENTLIFPTPEEIKRCYPILDVGAATLYYNEAWNKIKSS